MEWVEQTKGRINHYNPAIHLGRQPVRVLHHMLLFMFKNAYPGFSEEINEMIITGKLDPILDFQFGKDPIQIEGSRFRTPRVNLDEGKIQIHESFLSYLWCCTYAIYTLYIETIDYPNVNRQRGEEFYRVSEKKIMEARSMLEYARLRIVVYEDWNIELPNPEQYMAEDRNYIEQTNFYYTEAVKFILCHEYSHLKLHRDSISTTSSDNEHLAFEKEADFNAIEMMKKGIFQGSDELAISQKMAVEIGAVFGMLAMFFFRSTTAGRRHPNTEDRLTDLLEQFGMLDNPYAWGIACMGLQLWDEQFGHSFEWDEEVSNYKDQYYKIINQIKKRQNA